MSVVTPDCVFYGYDGAECEEFIRQIRLFARSHGKGDDPIWTAHKAAACFVEDALHWHIALDDEIRDNWKALERALVTRYPKPDNRMSGYLASKLVPTAPVSASGANPRTATAPRPGVADEPPSVVFNSAWVELDNDATTISIVARAGRLYQLQSSGRVLGYNGVEWQLLDNNKSTVQIETDGENLYQRHDTGSIFVYTGTPLSGWVELDNNPATVDIVASVGHLYQLHKPGRILKYTGTPYIGWEILDKNLSTIQIVADGEDLYQRHSSGDIYMYKGKPFSWHKRGSNSVTVDIYAGGGHLYQRHNSGRIYAFRGETDPRWWTLDGNAATVQVIGDGKNVYQRHKTGNIYFYTGTSWAALDQNPCSAQITLDGTGELYQRHDTGKIFKYAGNRM